VVAVGVLALVVACLSGLANLMFGGFAMVSYGISRSYSTMATTPAVATPAAVVTTGMSMTDATVAVNSVQALLNLDGARVRELTKMMRLHGKDVFSFEEDEPVGAAGISEKILRHGAAPSDDEPAYFATGEGRVDVFADHTVFTSADGGRKIETSAAKNSDTDSAKQGPTSGPATQPGDALTAARVRKVMNAVKKAAQQPINNAQLSTIEAQISSPNQQLVNPAGASPVTTVTAYSIGPQGNSVTVQFDYGSVTVGPNGELTGMYSYKMSVTGAATTAVYAPPTQKLGAMLLMMAEAAASTGLAIYLLVVGILVFRSSFNSPRLLRIYAWVKIPLAVTAAVALVLVNYASAGSDRAQVVLWAVALGAAGMAFPIGLLVALRSRTLKEFFGEPVGTAPM
jgi:hypothetical protein